MNLKEMTEEEKLLRVFDEVVMRDEKPYTKTFKLGNINIVFRTKESDEWENVLEYTQKVEPNSVLMIHKFNMCMLACSLVSIGDEIFDKGTLGERLKRVGKMPMPKRDILIDLLKKFDTEVEDIRTKYQNFYLGLSQDSAKD